MTSRADRKHPVYPPVYFLLAVMAMLGLHWLVPGPRWSGEAPRVLGWLLLGLGLGLALWANRLFRHFGTTVKPFQKSTQLVTSGPYRFTRNPMYLGMAAVLLGVAAFLGSIWPLVVVPVFMALIERRFIRVEEAGLAATFGEAYAAFRSRVRRWL